MIIIIQQTTKNQVLDSNDEINDKKRLNNKILIFK